MTKNKEEAVDFPSNYNFIVHKTTGQMGMTFPYTANSGKCQDCNRAKPQTFTLLDSNKSLELCMTCLDKSFIPVSF